MGRRLRLATIENFLSMTPPCFENKPKMIIGAFFTSWFRTWTTFFGIETIIVQFPNGLKYSVISKFFCLKSLLALEASINSVAFRRSVNINDGL